MEKHQPTRKWGSSKYSSREMPRYSEEEKKKMGIITGKLRPKPDEGQMENKDDWNSFIICRISGYPHVCYMDYIQEKKLDVSKTISKMKNSQIIHINL